MLGVPTDRDACPGCRAHYPKDANFCYKCGRERGDDAEYLRRKATSFDVEEDKGEDMHVKVLSRGGHFNEALAENQELYERIEELERINKHLMDEREELEELRAQVEQMQMRPRRTTMRATMMRRRTESNKPGAPSQGMSLGPVLEDDEAEELRYERVRLLWQKAMQAVRLSNGMKKMVALRKKLEEVVAKCAKADAEIEALRKQLKEAQRSSEAQRELVGQERVALAALRQAHEVEKQNLLREKKALEEDLSAMHASRFSLEKTETRQRLVTCNLMTQLDAPDSDAGEEPDDNLAQEERMRLELRIQELERQLASAAATIAARGQQRDQLEGQLDKASSMGQLSLKQQQELQEKLADTQRQLALASAASPNACLAEYQRQLGEAHAARDKALKEAEALRAALATSQASEHKDPPPSSPRPAGPNPLADRLALTERELASAAEELESLAAERDQLEARVHELEAELGSEGKDPNLNSLAERLATTERELASANAAADAMARERDQLDARVRDLEAKLDSHGLDHANETHEARPPSLEELQDQLQVLKEHGTPDLLPRLEELERQLILARKSEEEWKERYNQPWWQRMSQAFCVTQRPAKLADGAVSSGRWEQADSTGGFPTTPSPPQPPVKIALGA